MADVQTGPRTLPECFEGGFNVAITCANRRCGHSTVWRPQDLQSLCTDRGWADTLLSLRDHLKCRICHTRRPFVRETRDRAIPRSTAS